MAGVAADVRVFTDAEALSEAAATLFVETAADAIRRQGHCTVCLSGGTTPSRTYTLLAQSPRRDLVDWPRMHFFWGDERCVPPEDLHSNYRAAREILLSRVPVGMENVHRVRTELEPDLAAQDYALTLNRHAQAPRRWPRWDLVLLGLGDDGHTASLFPHMARQPGLAAMAVEASEASPPGWRVTLTPEVLNDARRIVFLVQGAGKSAVVARVLYGASDPDTLPAQMIHPTDGELIWLLDSGAAEAGKHP
ncbi:MAG TPA: 6-phosphogluconolactonase [Anaerolineales bacterium]|nr:6-phosphogluconolactonase [Anaerolineales bacterium]